MPETAVKERPILFSGEMVRAILDGRKTQTRRPLKAPQPLDILPMLGDQEGRLWAALTERGETPDQNRGALIRCRYGLPGDRLYVREAHTVSNGGDVIYRAGYPENAKARGLENIPPEGEIRWRPSIHMPRWASRLTLEIADVRVERAQDITEGDAVNEGIEPADRLPCGGDSHDPRQEFAELWDSINGPRGFGWDENPWVWVVSFKRLEAES